MYVRDDPNPDEGVNISLDPYVVFGTAMPTIRVCRRNAWIYIYEGDSTFICGSIKVIVNNREVGLKFFEVIILQR